MNQTQKYRTAEYDIHDETYAKRLSEMFIIESYHNKIVQNQFNLFTDNLMNEKKINRYSLLNAIDDYKKTENGRAYPLNNIFEDCAFNFRPYQCW